MSNDKPAIEMNEEERAADSRADMWSCVALVVLAWVATMYWVSGQ